jgi:hypothetical protein
MTHHAADAAFAWAVAAFLAFTWGSERAAAWGGLLFVCGIELAQTSGLIAGTFDPVDLLVSAAAYAAAWRVASRTTPPSPAPRAAEG